MNNIDMLVDQLTAKTQPTIVQVSTNKLHPFPAHPFKVQDDEDMEQLHPCGRVKRHPIRVGSCYLAYAIWWENPNGNSTWKEDIY